MGQTTSKNTKNQQKRKIHVQALPCTNWFHLVPNWFLRGSYLVTTVFDSSGGCSYKLKSHLLVLMHMQCSKIGVKMFKFKVLSTAVQPLTKLSHPFLDSSTVHRSTYRRTYRLKQLRSKLIQVRSRQVPTKIPTHPIKIQTTTKLETCAQKTRFVYGSWVPSEMDY